MKNWFMSHEIKSILLLPIISTNRINIWCGRCHCKTSVAYRFSHKPQNAQFIIIKKPLSTNDKECEKSTLKIVIVIRFAKLFFFLFIFFFFVYVASKSWQVSNINKFKIKFILYFAYISKGIFEIDVMRIFYLILYKPESHSILTKFMYTTNQSSCPFHHVLLAHIAYNVILCEIIMIHW